MIKFLFLTIPNQCTYDQLKTLINFKQDIYGVTTWTMKHPLTLYSADLNYKHVFKLNDVKIQPVTNVSLEQKWKYFVITKGDGGKYYCTSQIIYEKGLLKTLLSHNQSQFFSSYTTSSSISPSQEFYLPKCIVIISELPYFKLQVNLLKIHKELKKKQPAISYCIEEDLYNIYLEYLQTGRQKQFENLNLVQISSKKKTYCPIQLSFSYYVECCNNHNSGQCIYIQKASSRQVLHLYKLQNSSLYQIGYFFHLPFSAFSLRKIVSAILTEKQLIFTSSNPNLTVMVVQTLMQMILPLKWCYMYAPNLPVQLLQAAQQSFMPFIVGISKQHLSVIQKTNKIIVHIDSDQVQINYDNEEEQLNMISKKFQRFLTWKANSNKQYLEWQKQLRINSILMITSIFKKDIGGQKSAQMNQYFSQQQKSSQHKFYDQFLSKSMMYRKLIQDVHQNVYSQFYKLTKMNFSQRKIHLQNKFNALHSQTIYPVKCDNKKKWIKFYEKYMRQKRKSRLNRHSLSMVEHNLIGIGHQGVGQHQNVTQNQGIRQTQPFYGSNVSLSSINSTNKIQPHQYHNLNNSFKSSIANQRNTELYQSTISSNSLNSQASTLKFNLTENTQRIGQGNYNFISQAVSPVSTNHFKPNQTMNSYIGKDNVAIHPPNGNPTVFQQTDRSVINGPQQGSVINGSHQHTNAAFMDKNSGHIGENENFSNDKHLNTNIHNSQILSQRNIHNNKSETYQSLIHRGNLNSTNRNQQSSLNIGEYKNLNQNNMTMQQNSHMNSNLLNQSMVGSFIFGNSNFQASNSTYQTMGTGEQVSSHRNLNSNKYPSIY